MVIECHAGSAFHAPTGDKKHVFVVVADPFDVKGYASQTAVLVSISTVRLAPFDNTCILQPGAHRVVIARSFAFYKLAEMRTRKELEELASLGVYTPIEPFDPAVVERICAGVLTSPHTRNNIKQFMRDRAMAVEVAADKAKRAMKKNG
jgi:hypothetical protein